MSLEPDVLTFDSFTTLVDVGTSTRRALRDHVDDPDPIALLWRSRAVDYRMVSAFTGVDETYAETTREALEYALSVHSGDLQSDSIDEIAAVFRELDVYPDVAPGMDRLVDAGYECYVLSNGDPPLLDTVVERAGIGELIEGTISAGEIGTYKPDPRLYEAAAERIGVTIEHVLHVATPWYDIYGAKHAGMQTAWMNRDDEPWDRFDGEPDVTVGGFEELCHELGV